MEVADRWTGGYEKTARAVSPRQAAIAGGSLLQKGAQMIRWPALVAALLLSALSVPAEAQQITCQSSKTVTVAAAVDTLIVAAVRGTDIFICDYEFSSNGTVNFFLETATSTACAGPVQLSNTWYTIANVGKTAANSTFRGMRTNGLSLCVNTSSSGSISITVYYSQQ